MNHPFQCMALKTRALTHPQCLDLLYFCLSSLLWSSLSWCSTQQMWWPWSLCGGVLPSSWGLAVWVRAARAAPAMRNHPKNVTAVTVQQQEEVQPRAVPVLSAGAGRGAAGIEGFWVPSSLFHHQANPLGPLEIKKHLDTVLARHSHREMGSRCPACARWEWTRWSLEAPSNLNLSMSSVISRKIELTEMWKIPQGVWNMALPLYLMPLSYYLEF